MVIAEVDGRAAVVGPGGVGGELELAEGVVAYRVGTTACPPG